MKADCTRQNSFVLDLLGLTQHYILSQSGHFDFPESEGDIVEKTLCSLVIDLPSGGNGYVR